MASIQPVLNTNSCRSGRSVREKWNIKWEGWGGSKQKRGKEYEADKIAEMNSIGRIYGVTLASKVPIRKE